MSLNNQLFKTRTDFKFANYSTNLGQVIAPSAIVPLQFNLDKDLDSSIVTKDVNLEDFTLVQGGIYRIDFKVRINNNGTATNSQFLAGGIQINGTSVSTANAALDIGIPTNGTIALTDSVSMQYTKRLNAGDILRFWAFQSNPSSVNRNVSTDDLYTNVTISRVAA